MEDLIKWLLSANGLSVTGITLAGFVAFLYSLHRKWLVPGWIYEEVCGDRDEYKAALDERNANDRQRADQLVAESTVMKQQIEDLKIALVKRQDRRARQGS